MRDWACGRAQAKGFQEARYADGQVTDEGIGTPAEADLSATCAHSSYQRINTR